MITKRLTPEEIIAVKLMIFDQTRDLIRQCLAELRECDSDQEGRNITKLLYMGDIMDLFEQFEEDAT